MSAGQPYMAAMLRLYQRGRLPLPEPPDNTPELPDSCWEISCYNQEHQVRSSGSGVAAPGSTPLQRR